MMTDMTMRSMWYKYTRNALKEMGRLDREDTSTIGQRQKLIDKVRECARPVGQFRDGTIQMGVSLNYDQMDCDCVRWTDGYVVPAIPRHVERLIEQVYADAEGPVYAVWIDKPDAYAQYYARDLALEAYEDGHPHVVYA